MLCFPPRSNSGWYKLGCKEETREAAGVRRELVKLLASKGMVGRETVNFGMLLVINSSKPSAK